MQRTDLFCMTTKRSDQEFWYAAARVGFTARTSCRLQIWLFKPSMRIAYSTPTPYLLPKVGNIHAAKVLYKILGPETASTNLTRYARIGSITPGALTILPGSIVSRHPGFPQAQHLSYPLDVCRRLAGLLKESNSAYPESMKVMTGLDVGFLQRS